MKEYRFYFSSIETGIKKTKAYMEKGGNIEGVVTDFSKILEMKGLAEDLKELREKYKIRVIINNNDNTEAQNLSLEWAKNNKDSYDYIMLDVYDERWLDIPVMPILHLDKNEGMNSVNALKVSGVSYFALAGFNKDLGVHMKLLYDLNEAGMKVHVIGFLPMDLEKFLNYIDSSDSSSWLSAGRLGELIVNKGNTYERLLIKENPVALKKSLSSKLSDIVPIDVLNRNIERKKYMMFNWYNMIEIQKFVDKISKKPKYQVQLDAIEEGRQVAPAWINEVDKLGRPKSVYLASRYNNYKGGVYAKNVQKYALMCDTCVVKDKCPVFEAGSTCYFTPLWKNLGAKTRNKEHILRTMERTIADTIYRLEKAKYFEDKSGGSLDKSTSNLAMDLAKMLQIMNEIMYGKNPTVGIVTDKLNINMDMDTALTKLREQYGEEVENKIKKNIEKMRKNETTDV